LETGAAPVRQRVRAPVPLPIPLRTPLAAHGTYCAGIGSSNEVLVPWSELVTDRVAGELADCLFEVLSEELVRLARFPGRDRGHEPSVFVG
jgi:hypothetical protein